MKRQTRPQTAPKEPKAVKARHRRQPWMTRRDWLIIAVGAAAGKALDGLPFPPLPRHVALTADSGSYTITPGTGTLSLVGAAPIVDVIPVGEVVEVRLSEPSMMA